MMLAVDHFIICGGVSCGHLAVIIMHIVGEVVRDAVEVLLEVGQGDLFAERALHKVVLLGLVVGCLDGVCGPGLDRYGGGSSSVFGGRISYSTVYKFAIHCGREVRTRHKKLARFWYYCFCLFALIS